MSYYFNITEFKPSIVSKAELEMMLIRQDNAKRAHAKYLSLCEKFRSQQISKTTLHISSAEHMAHILKYVSFVDSELSRALLYTFSKKMHAKRPAYFAEAVKSVMYRLSLVDIEFFETVTSDLSWLQINSFPIATKNLERLLTYKKPSSIHVMFSDNPYTNTVHRYGYEIELKFTRRNRTNLFTMLNMKVILNPAVTVNGKRQVVQAQCNSKFCLNSMAYVVGAEVHDNH